MEDRKKHTGIWSHKTKISSDADVLLGEYSEAADDDMVTILGLVKERNKMKTQLKKIMQNQLRFTIIVLFLFISAAFILSRSDVLEMVLKFIRGQKMDTGFIYSKTYY